MDEEKTNKVWKVKCKNCKKEYEIEIGNVQGLRKQYCLHCRCVGTLSIVDETKGEWNNKPPVYPHTEQKVE